MIQQIDSSILDWMQSNLRCGFLDFLMTKITFLGDKGIFFIVLGALLLIFKRYRRTGASVLTGMTCGFIVVNQIVKTVVARLRPSVLNPSVELLAAVPDPYSFPSGHTMHAFIVATVLMYYDKRLGIPTLVLAVLMAFSRMYLYMHFPTDVLAGAAFGVLFGFAGILIVKKAIRVYSDRKAAKTAQ